MSDFGAYDNNILDGIKFNNKKYFDGFIPLKDVEYSIAIIYDTNYRKDIYNIKNPWQFINAMKKNPRIKACWIINENNP